MNAPGSGRGRSSCPRSAASGDLARDADGAVLTGGMTNVLILGGTAWLGALIAREWLDAGAAVTCLARGSSGSAPDGVDARARPTGPTRAPTTRSRRPEWDEVVELAWDPVLVGGALAALADRARHWTIVSSVSVYAEGEAIGADESAPLLEPDDPSDYGKAKVAAERATAAALGDRLLIVRPGLIVGPGDRSDRFGYWPARFALARRGAGAGAAPRGGLGAGHRRRRPRGLRATRGGARARRARWMPSASPCRSATCSSQAADVAGFTGEWVEASAAALADAGVAHWAGPRSLPLWLPADRPGFARRSHAAYDRLGGELRPLTRDPRAHARRTNAPAGWIASGGRGSPGAEELEVLDRRSRSAG